MYGHSRTVTILRADTRIRTNILPFQVTFLFKIFATFLPFCLYLIIFLPFLPRCRTRRRELFFARRSGTRKLTSGAAALLPHARLRDRRPSNFDARDKRSRRRRDCDDDDDDAPPSTKSETLENNSVTVIMYDVYCVYLYRYVVRWSSAPYFLKIRVAKSFSYICVVYIRFRVYV